MVDANACLRIIVFLAAKSRAGKRASLQVSTVTAMVVARNQSVIEAFDGCRDAVREGVGLFANE